MYMYFGTDLIMYLLQMSHAPVAEMDESEFNKHWDVMSNVSIYKHQSCLNVKHYLIVYSLMNKTSAGIRIIPQLILI